MSEPKSGDKLAINQVWNHISDQLYRAYQDPSNEYAKLRDLFEAAFGYALDKSITYIPSEEKFLVFDDTP